MRAFVPKTRLQVYKAWANPELQSIVPEKYLVEETTVIIDNKELSFSADGNNYAAELANSTVAIYPNDVVKYNGVEISQELAEMVTGHNTGDVYCQIIHTGGPRGSYAGAKIVSVGVEPTGTNHASVYRSTTRIKLAPKTNIEKYYAYKAGLYDGELPDPKTVDEKLECKLCNVLLADVGDIAPKTRSQWYRAKALELVEDVPESKLAPKTNIEKYYAYKAGLYDGELPEPKTVDEYYIALECGWEPAGQEDDSGKDHVPGGLVDNGGSK